MKKGREKKKLVTDFWDQDEFAGERKIEGKRVHFVFLFVILRHFLVMSAFFRLRLRHHSTTPIAEKKQR